MKVSNFPWCKIDSVVLYIQAACSDSHLSEGSLGYPKSDDA